MNLIANLFGQKTRKKVTMHITDDQIATFKKQGFLIIKNFLSKQEQEAALDGFFKVFDHKKAL